jgi:DNA topoisomerase-1
MWYRRLGTPKSGFRYVGDGGRRAKDRRTLERIDALRIPPGWRDVHVARSPSRAIQAWGYDVKGRKQYRYHARAVEIRDLRKYHRMRALARDLPKFRKRLRERAASMTLSRDAVAAVVARLISETFCRVGGERYAQENGSFGITTLRKSHLTLERGVARLEYPGKSRVTQRQIIAERELVRELRRLGRSPGARLFRYREAGAWRNLSARDVNDYFARTLGGYSAKDLRTWGGTLRAATVLAELGPAGSHTGAKRNVALAMRLVGAELGNTPAVCRSSYVHPMVIARYMDDGETIAIARHRDLREGFVLQSADERALIRFLDRHFPERRRLAREAGAGK